MNANELAALLEVDSWYKLVTREEIATMLRQQQLEIAELKNSRDYWCLQYKDVFNKLENMSDEVMSLENQIGMMTGYGHN